MAEKKEIVTVDKTLTEYCAFLGVSKPAIIYRMNNMKELPGIVSYHYDVAQKKYILKFIPGTKKAYALRFFQNLENYQKVK